jgi:hypothetical protein
MEIFENDEQGYQNWLNENPDGFVLNARNPPNRNYLYAHRAACRSINGNSCTDKDWTKKYIKICSGKLSELSAWTEEKFGYLPYFCRRCTPK